MTPLLGTFKFCARLYGSISTYILPLRDVVWLESPAFQEELVKSHTLHNFADPFLHNIVIKDIFAWVHLVSTEQITNRVSLEIIGIGYNSSEMDRDRYSDNFCSKLRQAMGSSLYEIR